MYEFNKRTSSKAPVPDNGASDAFSDSDWNPEDFEREISSSLQDNLKDSTEPQWNDMLDTFNSENYDDDAEVEEKAENDAEFSGGFDDDFHDDSSDSDDGFDDDFSDDSGDSDTGDGFDDDFSDDNTDSDISYGFGDGFSDNNGLNDDFDDDFGDNDDLGDFKSDFSNDFKPDFSDDFNDDFGDETEDYAAAERTDHPEKKSSGKGMIVQLLILFIAVVAGLAFLINYSLKKTIGENAQKNKGTESRMEVSSEVTVSSETPAAVSSEANVVSEDTTSSEETKNPSYKKLKKGDKNENVLLMQNRLCELGYCTEESCTGYYGDFTVKKVKQFQKAAGLEQTGTADRKTLERLYAKDAPKA